MASNVKRKNSEVDGDYEPGEETVEPTSKKSKPTAANTPQPQKSSKDLFSHADAKMIEKGLLELGNEYSKIKNEYFMDRKDLTPHDINNYVSRIPNLKKIQQSNLKKSRNSIVDNFRQSNFQEKEIILHNNNTGPTVTCIDDEETRIVKEPTRISSGMWLIPSVSFLRVCPFYTETPIGYHYCCRYHYAEPVSFRVNRDERKIIFKFKSLQSLAEEEYEMLQFFKPTPGKPVEIKLNDSENSLSNYIVHVPQDADLHTFCIRNSSVEAKDHLYSYHETKSGGLLELLIPKMQEINDDFSAPRGNVNISVRAKEIPLQGFKSTEELENEKDES